MEGTNCSAFSWKSLPGALHYRSTTSEIKKRAAIHESIYSHLSLNCINFTNWPQVCSPHISPLTSLDIDNTSEGRFLLCGSQDCTISVYDLSVLGSDYHLNPKSNLSSQSNRNSASVTEKERQRFHPVARSRRISVGSHDPHNLSTPAGHSHSVTQVKWYPVDSGIFLSSGTCGSILLWDTNTFTPVTSFNISPTLSGMASVSCMDMPNPRNTPSHLLLAIGSKRTSNDRPGLLPFDDRVIRLCDIKSGSVSHQLIGHGVGRNGYGGINALQWSPNHEFQLASAGNDGCVKVFDVRKSGSGACLYTLDKQRLEHRVEEVANEISLPLKRRRSAEGSQAIAPNNYSKAECSSYIQSHDGPVNALSFTPDGKYLVSASRSDQKIYLWDIQRERSGTLLPTIYLGPSDSSPHPIERKQSKLAFHVTQSGSERSAALWVGTGSLLLGYRLHGMGGRPDKVLSGHLDKITSITTQQNYLKIYTGCKDGMILSWGWKSDFIGNEELI